MATVGFFDGNYYYNLANLIVGASGLILGIVALLVAIFQFAKAKNAAEAAREASEVALARVSEVVAVATLERLCGRCRDLLHLARARDLSGAATAALELREGLAKFSASPNGSAAMDSTGWSKLARATEQIHEIFETAALIKRLDQTVREQNIHEISRIYQELSKLAGATAGKAVSTDGDSN